MSPPTMNSMLRTIAGWLIPMVLAAGTAGAQAPAALKTVRYSCDQGRSLVVSNFPGPSRTAPNGMPLPGGHVVLTQGDGTRRTLPQTPSGSGIPHANEGETFVLRSKGDARFG